MSDRVGWVHVIRRGQNKGLLGLKCTRRELRMLGLLGPSPHALEKQRKGARHET